MSQSALGIQFSAFLNVYGKFTVLSIVTDLGIRDYLSVILHIEMFVTRSSGMRLPGQRLPV